MAAYSTVWSWSGGYKFLHNQETLPRERTLGREDENIEMDAEEVNRKMFENITNETSLESPTKDFQFNPPSPPSPSSFDSLYSLTCQVGRGGFGVVYEGLRREEGGTVAVKYVWKDRVRRWGQVSI